MVGRAPKNKPLRGSYHRDFSQELAAIESKRRRLKITQRELCDRAGMTDRTLRTLFATGQAFRRQVVALRQALVALEREGRGRDGLFGAPA